MTQHTCTLPLELLTNICTNLSRCDLQNARLVSHAFNYAARSLLFRTIFLKINRNSFRRLIDISQHDELKKHVRSLEYDGRILGGKKFFWRSFGDWVRNIAGRGLCSAFHRRDFLAQFSGEQLQQYYLNYCNYWADQQYVRKRKSQGRMLVAALGRLPGLSSIQYYTECARSPRYDDQGKLLLSSLSAVTREILVELESPDDLDPDKYFWVLGNSTILNCGFWMLKWRSWNGSFKPLGNLRQLSLDFGRQPWPIYPLNQSKLSRILASTSSLQSLSLRFSPIISFTAGPQSNSGCDIPLDNLITTTQWAHLRHLSLQGVITTQAFLQATLLRHAQTLRSLSLSNIVLIFEPEQLHGQGCWLEVLRFLGSSLSLREITLRGDFKNEANEWWRTGGAKEYHDASWLRYRIEQFITNGAPCPFPAGTEVAVETDESWSLESKNLWGPHI